MSTTTNPPKAAQALERELASVCRKIEEATKLQDRRVHLFIDLRAAGITQARIGELAKMSDVGVVLAIKRHRERSAKLEQRIATARDDFERDSLRAERCPYCAQEATAAVG